MTSLGGMPYYQDLKMEPSMAVPDPKSHGFHQTHAGSGQIPPFLGNLDATEDLDHEWNQSTAIFNMPSGADCVQLSSQQETNRPAPSSQWKGFNLTVGTTPRSQRNDFQSSMASSLSSSVNMNNMASDSNPSTMSPSQMTLDHQPCGHRLSTGSVKSEKQTDNPKFSSLSGTATRRDGSMSSSVSSIFTPVEDDRPAKRRSVASVAAESDSADSTPAPTRSRRSSNVEPGTARAIYLEKNRHAARKCRTKQKKHQEVLVETARDMERKNKQLKAEVEFLKCDMRDLMGMVLEHNTCADQRLSRYVQREADRLAGSGSLSPLAKPEPPGTPGWALAPSPGTM